MAQPKYLRAKAGRRSSCFQPNTTEAAIRPKSPPLAPRLGLPGLIASDSSPPTTTAKR
jgi:hypothetical protein